MVAALPMVLMMALSACDRGDLPGLSAEGQYEDLSAAKQAGTTRTDTSRGDRREDADSRQAESDQEPDDGSQPTSVEAAVPSHVLWSATHERETVGEEWGGTGRADDAPGPGGGGLYNSGIRSFELSTEQARSGSHSLKTVIDTVDASGSKENKAAVRAFRWAESESYRDLSFSVWYYIPQHVRPTHFWNIFQFKSKVLDADNKTLTTDPIWTINIDNRNSTGAMYAYLYYHGKYFPNGSSERYEQSGMNIPVGKWFNLEAHLVQSTGRNADGRLTVWQDGELLWDMHNVRTQHGLRDISGGARVKQSWSANNYSNGLQPSVATIYLDDAAISRSRIWHE